LIEIGHPAHVHYFKNLARVISGKGGTILFTTRDKEMTIGLLQVYEFKYINFGRPFRSKAGKIWGLFWFTLRLFIIAVKFKPDMILNATQYGAIVAWLLDRPHISLEDTFNFEQVRLYLSFTSAVLTGNYPHPALGNKEIHYNGYQELLYLHPNRFLADPKIFNHLGILPQEKYVILRFISRNASHDYGHKGISLENKKKLVLEISRLARVFISSESELPTDLACYRLTIPQEKIHDAIAFASLLYGESATMASEAAMLGTPAIYIDSTGRFYTQDQEKKYGLVFNYSESEEDQQKAIKKCIMLLKTPNLKEEWKNRTLKMLNDKIDVNAFLVWFVEKYPESFKIMKENMEYQNRFR
jgi:predicted glycosyltransferase